MIKLITSPRLKSILFVFVTVLVASGCTIKPDTSIIFKKDSPKAIVIGGIDSTQNNELFGIIQQFSAYDKNTQRLLPDVKFFFLYDTSVQRGLQLTLIEPGDYVVTNTQMFYDKGPLSSRIRDNLIATKDLSPVTGIQFDARVGGISAYRISIQPGEVVYLGEFVFTAFKPKWENRQQELDALMTQMKHVSVKPVFRPPTIRRD